MGLPLQVLRGGPHLQAEAVEGSPGSAGGRAASRLPGGGVWPGTGAKACPAAWRRAPAPRAGSGKMTGSLTALEMLRHRQRPLPGPRGSPGTAEKRGHRWPHATGGAQASSARWRRPRSPWGLVNRPADAEEVGDGKCPATPHPIAQEEVAWLQGPGTRFSATWCKGGLGSQLYSGRVASRPREEREFGARKHFQPGQSRRFLRHDPAGRGAGEALALSPGPPPSPSPTGVSGGSAW